MKKTLFLGLLLTLPTLTLAAENSLQNFLGAIPGFINGILIPVLFSLAFLMLTYNAVRYFIIGGTDEKGQENAKNLALYSAFAFVFLISLWGIVNLLLDTYSGGVNDTYKPICPDYLVGKPGGCVAE